MRSAEEKWNRKYSGIDVPDSLFVDPLLEKYSDLLEFNGNALDIAAGICQSSVYLALRGFEVTSVDCSSVGLSIGQKLAKKNDVSIKTIVLDFEKASIPVENWSLICCFRYLNISLLKLLIENLSPGGLLIFKTFNENYLNTSQKFNKNYVLKPGELSDSFSGLDTIEISDGMKSDESMSWIVAQKIN
tara:strand:+ start:299 stop:862 length:564 start_codon:yes stop_codon:yes gene_type:complete